MNRERAKELAPIIKAFGDGEDIHFRQCGSLDWHYTESPAFSLGYEFRIRPKPREIWLYAGLHDVWLGDDPTPGVVDAHRLTFFREVLGDES